MHEASDETLDSFKAEFAAEIEGLNQHNRDELDRKEHQLTEYGDSIQGLNRLLATPITGVERLLVLKQLLNKQEAGKPKAIKKPGKK
jgi:hypothetical protein